MKPQPAVLFFIVSLIGFSPSGRPVQAADSRPADLQHQIETVISRIYDEYGLRIFYKGIPDSRWPQILYQQADPGDYPGILRYLGVFEEEIRKYPPGFSAKIRLKGFILIKKLFYNEKPGEGLYDFRNNVVFLDFARRKHNLLAKRHNLHHEIFHVIAYQTGHTALQRKDEAWGRLETGDLKNDPGENPAAGTTPFTPPQPGFITHYAMSATDEDKAEVFAGMMVASQHRVMLKWAQKDPILRKKLKEMKAFIQDFEPGMDEGYWSRLTGGL